MSAKEPAGRLHRWALTLQEYEFEIQYRPGREIHVADASPRRPVEDTNAVEADADNDPVIVHPLPDEVAAENSHRSQKDEAEHETAVIREVITTGRDDGRVARDAY
ncbi:unnamed protein product [Phytophthora fragariaefolia]|uniref:Unnamed protein product n=1 Tax=Phytophthora fragariaefolia TaxID=1490495 RepID=A0A9W7CW48_9STRA|nr:unnamed protein product [Phytophthora fragariaefolia]